MAVSKKISELPVLLTVDGADLIAVVDVVDGVTKQATIAASNNRTELVTAANIIVANETGKKFFLNSATGFPSTLPPPAPGLEYTFIVTAAPVGADHTVVTDAGDNIMEVHTLDIVGELVPATAQDVVTFVDGVSLINDNLHVISDGTKWYCEAVSGADGGITTGVT